MAYTLIMSQVEVKAADVVKLILQFLKENSTSFLTQIYMNPLTRCSEKAKLPSTRSTVWPSQLL